MSQLDSIAHSGRFDFSSALHEFDELFPELVSGAREQERGNIMPQLDIDILPIAVL